MVMECQMSSGWTTAVGSAQHAVMGTCIAGIGVCLFLLALLRMVPSITRAIKRWIGLDKLGKVICAACIVGAVMYGGSKGVSIRWDTGLRDNGSEVTNSTVRIRWIYQGVPAASSVFIDYRLAGSTNEWANLGEGVASALGWDGTLEDATNYEYWVYSTYVPPVPVHTNGVWVGQTYETKARVGAKAFLILNGKVQEHGRTIAPPGAKRKDED